MIAEGKYRGKKAIENEALEKDVQGYLSTQDIIQTDLGYDEERVASPLRSLRNQNVHYLEDDDDEADLDTDTDEDDLDPESLLDDFEQDIEISEPSFDDLMSEENREFEAQIDLEVVSGNDTVGIYLKEMALVPLLEADEELVIAKQIEAGKQAIHELAEKDECQMSPDYHADLMRMAEMGSLAREHLIKANTRLVVSIAKRYVGRGVHFLDLIQEGNLGLMKAVEKYEYWRGFRFSTYATWWIRQTITRAIADQGRTIRVPVHMVDRIRTLYRQMHDLEQELGHRPCAEELADRMDVSVKKISWMLRVSWLPLSLESPVSDNSGGEEEAELGMFVEDEFSPNPIQATNDNLLGDKINEILGTLPPREERILRLRFGLENGRVYTLEEVGQKFGLTRERIRQIEGKALCRLRHPRRARKLRGFYID
ncbi:MAG: sigma-70 family RNA polymerase sigma factor [Anaerolineaceae bacterium]|nr:sigma-70 family RNA polymerase sigma factor [Anaerolineaceae bacterium]